MRNSVKSVVAGVVTLAVAGVMCAAGATSAAAAAPVFDPDPNKYGTITFYDVAGNVVTSGDANDPLSMKYAVASTNPTSPVANKRAMLLLYGPQPSVNPGLWSGIPLNANTLYPIATAPAPVSASAFPATAMLATSTNMKAASTTFTPNTPASGLQNVFQMRLKSALIPDYAATTITIDPVTNVWTQIDPVPVVPATATTTALAVTPPSPATTPVNPTLTATVSPATAAGTVEFFDGLTPLGASSPLNAGVATTTLTGVTAGTHSYTAKFIPTTPTAFTTSTSAARTYQVNPAPMVTPTVGLTASPAASTLGDTVTFTATLAPNVAGTIEFFDGTNSLAAATATDTAGTATLASGALALGTHQVTARFVPTNATLSNGATSPAVPVTVSAVNPDDPTPIVTLTNKPGVVTRSTTALFAYVGSDSSGAPRTWTYTCSLDGAAYTACPSTKSYSGLTSALHTFRVKAANPSGNESDPVSHIWRVDTVAPSVSLGALPAFSQESTIVPTWKAQDIGAGVATTDVRWARASWSAGWSAWMYPSGWQQTTATNVTMHASRGYTYCFAVRTRDLAGNTSAWSTMSCTSVALDDRMLGASTGWTRVTSSRFYVGTATATTRANVTLTRTGVQTKRIALIATTCPTCGTVGVYLNGILIKKVSLYAATTSRRSTLSVAAFSSLRSGTVTVRTLTSGKAIQIDGLGLSRV